MKFSRQTIANRTLGFTLMEVLLALAVSAVILSAIGGVFFSALRLRDRTTAMLDDAAPLQRTVTAIRKDLQGAIAPSGEMTGNFSAAAADDAMGSGYLLRFRTTAGTLQDAVPWGDVEEVGYSLRAPASRNGQGQDLVRSVARNLLSTMTTEPEEQVLMGNVRHVEFECFDGSNWRTSWDTASGDTNLPVAVRARLELAGTDSRSDSPIEILVPLITQSLTNSPSGGAP